MGVVYVISTATTTTEAALESIQFHRRINKKIKKKRTQEVLYLKIQHIHSIPKVTVRRKLLRDGMQS